MNTQPNYRSDPTLQQGAVIEPVLKRALYDLYRAVLYVP
ncbi:MAG: hypothetical protein KatS3mg019_1149 [Fimbriimonadales bacterium]|nr:MAG: hypothetical protein KatS3mg019_1149 [Fimbriimonadales bacterium]